MPSEISKRYYSISEVATLLDEATSVLRYWEREFEQLRPATNSKGDRRYVASDIEKLKQIHQLVRQEGYTIEGAKQAFAKAQQRETQRQQILKFLQKTRQRLEKMI